MSCVTIACMTPPVSTPCSTAAAIEPALRIWLIARMWCSCPCSTPLPRRQVDPERRAVERGLDVVGGQRVAGEQHVDVARLDEGDHRRRGAGVHDGRTADPEHLAAVGLHLAHLRGDLPQQQRLRLLARHRGAHEAEASLVPSRHREHDLHPAGAADDLVPGAHVADRHRAYPAVRRRPARSPSPAARRAPRRRRAARPSRGWSWSRSRPGRRRRCSTGRSSASPGSTWLTPWVCRRMSSRASDSSSADDT